MTSLGDGWERAAAASRNRLLAAVLGVNIAVTAGFGVILYKLFSEPQQRQVAVAPQTGTGGPAATSAATSVPGANRGTGAQAVVIGGSAGSAGSGGRGAGAGQGGAQFPGGVILVGGIFTESGAAAAPEAEAATRAYFDLVNDSGGVDGARLEYITADDGLDPTRGSSELSDMVQNKHVFALATWQAPATEQQVAAPGGLLEQYRIPLVGAFGQTDEYQTQWAYVFSTEYGSIAYVMAQFAAQKRSTFEPVCGMYIDLNQATSQRIHNVLVSSFQQAGVAYKTDQKEAPTATDYSPALLQMRSAGCRSVVTFLDDAGYEHYYAATQETNYNPPEIGAELQDDPAVHRADDGIMAQQPDTYTMSDFDLRSVGDPEYSALVSTMQRYEPQYVNQIDWLAEVNWVGAKIFVEALRRLPAHPRPSDMMAAVNSIANFQTGLTEPLTVHPWSGDPNVLREPNHCGKIYQFASGTFVPRTGWICRPGAG